MNNQEWDGLDPARSRLRALAAHLEKEVLGLASPAGHGVLEAWRALSAALALGTEPVLRKCPHCRRGILSEATRCRYCMKQSDAQQAPR